MQKNKYYKALINYKHNLSLLVKIIIFMKLYISTRGLSCVSQISASVIGGQWWAKDLLHLLRDDGISLF